MQLSTGPNRTSSGAQQMSDFRSKADIAAYPIPACRIVAVTMPPAEESAFIVNLIG
jgi:hypothetical protein